MRTYKVEVTVPDPHEHLRGWSGIIMASSMKEAFAKAMEGIEEPVISIDIAIAGLDCKPQILKGGWD